MSFQREVYSTNETFAFPGEIHESAHTVSNSAKIDIARYSSREFNLWPYVLIYWEQSDFAEDSPTASVKWILWDTLRRNTDGDRLPATFTLSRFFTAPGYRQDIRKLVPGLQT